MIKLKSKSIFIFIAIILTLFFFVRYYSFFVIFSNCPNFDEACVSQTAYYAIDYGTDGVIFACGLLDDKSSKASCYESALRRISERGKEENKARKICQAIPEDVKDKYYEQYQIKSLCEPVILLTSEIDEKVVGIGKKFDFQITVKNEGKIFRTDNMFLDLPCPWITSEEPLMKDISGISPGEEKKIVWTIELTDEAWETFWINAVVKYGENLELIGPEKGIVIHTKRKIIVDRKAEEITDIDFPLSKEEASSIIKKFCEPKGYKYESGFASNGDEKKVATKWKFPTSEPKFTYYALVDKKTGATNCAAGIKEEWKTYKDENISFDYPPNSVLYRNPNGQIDIIKENEIIPILSFSGFTSDSVSLKEWIIETNNKLGNKILSMDPVWEYGINTGDAQEEDHLYYAIQTPSREYGGGLVFKFKDDYDKRTYHFWSENQDEEASMLYLKILSSIKLNYKFNIANWKTYKNEKYGYEIKYPSGWEFYEEKEVDRHIVNLCKHPSVHGDTYCPLSIYEIFYENEHTLRMFKKDFTIFKRDSLILAILIERFANTKNYSICQQIIPTFRFLE